MRIAWRIFSNLCALIVVSGAVAYGIVTIFAGDGDVWSAKNFRLVTPEVKIGGRLIYSVDVIAHESCPGEQVMILTSRTNHGPPAIVSFRRPVLFPGQSRDDVPVNAQLPESVFAGQWLVVGGVESKCPKRTRFDELFRFDLTVTP